MLRQQYNEIVVCIARIRERKNDTSQCKTNSEVVESKTEKSLYFVKVMLYF